LTLVRAGGTGEIGVQAFIKAVGAGKKRARNLARAEAAAAMRALLATRDEAQVGAFLLAMRMKGETGDELAGFVDALGGPGGPTARPGAQPQVDVDAHGDGREGRPSLLPAAAILAARAGLDVLVRVDASGVRSRQHVAAVLAALLPHPGVRASNLETEQPDLKRLLDMRARVGVRTFVNSLVKLWSPRAAPVRVVGIFHGPYHEPMARALALLGVRGLVVQAPGGLPEPPPDKPCKLTSAEAPEHTVTFDPRGFGDPVDQGALPEVATAAETLALNQAALDGRRGAARKAALLGAATLLTAAGLARDLHAGFSTLAQGLQ